MVSCLIQDVTGFWGVGGISDSKLQTFRVDADRPITNEFPFSSDRRDLFNRAFHQWLSDTYSDAYNEMEYGFISSSGPGLDTRNPDHTLVAYSDKYPLDPTDQ